MNKFLSLILLVTIYVSLVCCKPYIDHDRHGLGDIEITIGIPGNDNYLDNHIGYKDYHSDPVLDWNDVFHFVSSQLFSNAKIANHIGYKDYYSHPDLDWNDVFHFAPSQLFSNAKIANHIGYKDYYSHPVLDWNDVFHFVSSQLFSYTNIVLVVDTPERYSFKEKDEKELALIKKLYKQI